MTRKSGGVDRLTVANPCQSDWQAMTGNRQRRFCQKCNKNVYNLSAMTRDEADALIARFEGRLCARFERDETGVVFTKEAQAAPQLISRRVSPVAAALVTALVGLSGNALAMTSIAGAPAAIHASSDREDRAPQPQGPTTTLSGVIKDLNDSVIPYAVVVLIDEKTGAQHMTASSNDGTYQFASLPDGVYRLKVESPGFVVHQQGGVTVRGGTATNLDVELQAEQTREVVMGDVVYVPPSLRVLHQQSQLIVVARVGRSAVVKRASRNQMIKTALDIDSLVKGSHKPSSVFVYHWGWGENQLLTGNVKTGDTVLVFLTPRSQGGGFELTDSTRGVKKLSGPDLIVHLQRLEELNTMAQAKKPSVAALVEWLVRCAEQRATRWEGTLELAQGAASPAEDESDPEASGKAEAGFAARLSDAQKSRLKAALFNTDALAEDDLQLVELVQDWNDERFVPFLLEQLRRLEANPPRLAERIMAAIAAAMRDHDVATKVELYSHLVSYADLDAEEEARREEAETADGEEAEAIDSEEAETADAPEAETEGGEDEAEASEAATTAAPDAASARQARSQMLQSFIRLVETKRAKS